MKSLVAVMLAALTLAIAVHIWFPVTTTRSVAQSSLSSEQVQQAVTDAVSSSATVLVDPSASVLTISSTGKGPVSLEMPPEQLGPVALLMAEQGVPVQWPEVAISPGASRQENSVLLSTARWVLASLLIGVALYCLITLVFRWKTGERFSPQGNQVSVIPDTRFAHVAGVDEAVAQLSELVAHLKDPESLASLGVKPPRGALLVGPPGTGKTLLARAVAGEAEAAFFEAAGSDFMERLVGVGASRVRDLFKAASKHPRAIIFIDEIDAIGAVRQNSDALGSSESDHTLVALLSELDGFVDRGNIVVLAATNRPDILDPALTRPGRLDRKIEVPLPDRRGREGILAVHSRDVPLAPDADLNLVARRTPGFSGAQLERVLQEAALNAHRAGRESVQSPDLDEAIATVVLGVPRTSAVVTETDRTITAWHEAGHALAALALPDAPQPAAISIIPRGAAGGATWMTESDSVFFTRAQAQSRMAVMLAGQAAERILLNGDFTQGASHDIARATELAESMVGAFAMSDSIPSARRALRTGSWPADVQDEIDSIVSAARDVAARTLSEHSHALRELAELLLEQESLGDSDIEAFASQHSLSLRRPAPALRPSQPIRGSSEVFAKHPRERTPRAPGYRSRVRAALAELTRRPRPGSSPAA